MTEQSEHQPPRGTRTEGRLNHVATVVSDLERSAGFYTALLGLLRTRTVRLADHTICYLSDGSDTQVELIERDRTGEPEGVPTRGRAAPGLRHTAWNVADAGAAARLAAELGGTVTSGPSVVKELGFVSVLVEDPDGTEFELVEWLPQSASSQGR